MIKSNPQLSIRDQSDDTKRDPNTNPNRDMFIPSMNMNKAFEYNFFPSKEEEEARGEAPPVITRRLVEIRGLYPPLQRDPANPWAIRRTLSGKDILDGRILVPEKDLLDHVLKEWPLELADYIIKGGRRNVPSVDCTHPSRSHEHMYIESVPTDPHWFVLGWTDGLRDRFQCGDEIGLFWDDKANLLNFKLLNHAPSSSSR